MREFIDGLEPCPGLPGVDEVLGPAVTRALGASRGADYYLAALRYAQSLWREGRPAQAILQLNKAWSADLKGNEAVLIDWPSAYPALEWMLRHAPAGRFLGNPVRHFQHLATRMSGPRAEIRRWRAWACFQLAEGVLPAEEFPRDERQVEREMVRFPAAAEVVEALGACGWPGEGRQVAALLAEIAAGRSAQGDRR